MKHATSILLALFGLAAAAPAQLRLEGILGRHIQVGVQIGRESESRGPVQVAHGHGRERGGRNSHRDYRDYRDQREHGYWRTIAEEVVIPGYWRDECTPARYGWVADHCGKLVWTLIAPACSRRVWVPPRCETRTRRVWVRC